MGRLRVLGAVLVVWGALSILVLGTSYEWVATDYSVARFAAATDRRAGNAVEGPVDRPMVIAGGAVLMVTGLWVGLLVPYVMNRNTRQMRRDAGLDDPDPPVAPPT